LRNAVAAICRQWWRSASQPMSTHVAGSAAAISSAQVSAGSP
jgi:hypothetical protein